jgi:hypothetical protein
MFSMMEMLIIVMMPPMIALMFAVHAWAPISAKSPAITSVVFMGLLAGGTCSVHFVILILSRQTVFANASWLPQLLSFKWPSVPFVLDILGWDVFFALSMLFAAPCVQREPLSHINPRLDDLKRGNRARGVERRRRKRYAPSQYWHRWLCLVVSSRRGAAGRPILQDRTVWTGLRARHPRSIKQTRHPSTPGAVRERLRCRKVEVRRKPDLQPTQAGLTGYASERARAASATV